MLVGPLAHRPGADGAACLGILQRPVQPDPMALSVSNAVAVGLVVARVLESTGDNYAETSRILGIDRSTVRRRARSLGE